MTFDLEHDIYEILVKLSPICDQLFNTEVSIDYYIINNVERPGSNAYYDIERGYIVFQRPVIFMMIENIEQLRDLVIHEVSHLIHYQIFKFNEYPNKENGMGHNKKFFEIFDKLEDIYPDNVERVPFRTYFSKFSNRIDYCILKLKNYSRKSKVKIHRITDKEFKELQRKYGPTNLRYTVE